MGHYEAQEDEMQTERQTCLTRWGDGGGVWAVPGCLVHSWGGSRTRKVGGEKQFPVLVTTYLDNCDGCRELMGKAQF